MKYQVIFFNNNDETIVNQKFNSVVDANKWADELKYDYVDIAIDDDGNDYWKTFFDIITWKIKNLILVMM